MNADMQPEKIGKISKVMKNFYPTYVYDKVENIPYELLKELNIKLILLDMDNTLIDHKGIYSKELKKWIKNIKTKGIKPYIISNSISEIMVKKISKELGLQYYYKAKKPSLKGYYHILQETKLEKENILMIGDQLFTDIWGGNRFGIQTILVKPINKKEIIISRIKRPFERIILKHYNKKRGKKEV